MLVIRLARVGKKNSPAYRVVVADKRRAVKRKFIEILGSYNPTKEPKELAISKDRAVFWIDRGAQPSDTVRNLMVDLEILSKDQKIKIVYGKEKSKKAFKEDAGKKPEEKEASGLGIQDSEKPIEAEAGTPVEEPVVEKPTETETIEEDKIEEKIAPTDENVETESVKQETKE